MQNDKDNTGAPLSSDTASQPVVAQPLTKSPRKTFRILLAILFSILLVTGAAVAYYMYAASQVTPVDMTENVIKDKTAVAPHKPVSEYIAELQTKMSGTITIETTSTPSQPVAYAPVYKPEGYDFSVYSTKSIGFLSTGSKSLTFADYETIGTYLKSNNFTESIIQQGTETTAYVARYESKDSICEASYNTPNDGTVAYRTLLSCSEKSDYLPNAEKIAIFYPIFMKANSDAKNVAFANLTIENSETSGYKVASLSTGSSDYDKFGGYASLFYQTPDQEWHFFTSTQSMLVCDQYDTDALRKAYSGTQCIDAASGTNREVKP